MYDLLISPVIQSFQCCEILSFIILERMKATRNVLQVPLGHIVNFQLHWQHMSILFSTYRAKALVKLQTQF